MDKADMTVLLRALIRHANYAHQRANEIAQDRSVKSKPEWLGEAQDEAERAERLYVAFRDSECTERECDKSSSGQHDLNSGGSCVFCWDRPAPTVEATNEENRQ